MAHESKQVGWFLGGEKLCIETESKEPRRFSVLGFYVEKVSVEESRGGKSVGETWPRVSMQKKQAWRNRWGKISRRNLAAGFYAEKASSEERKKGKVGS